MGLFQKAYETYENLSMFVGEMTDGINEFKEPLAPIGHITASSGIEIKVDNDGRFISAYRVDKKDHKIVIPVTEESASRTSKSCPHPLCDNLGYLYSHNENKYNDYLKCLEEWINSDYVHPMLIPIYKYVKSGTIKTDLETTGIDGTDEKIIVRWVVVSSNEEENGECWAKKSLFESFSNYYLNKKLKDETCICMVSGREVPAAKQHIKGISSINGNAKLISSNDTSNFTYKGRFFNDSQSVSIGYESSQKCHNALKWIISNQGTIIGGRTFVCWSPKGRLLIRPSLSILAKRDKPILTVINYRQELAKVLMSYNNKFAPCDEAVIAIFDAATTGRLALTYYSEMLVSDYMDKLALWDMDCCWNHAFDGIKSPSLERIISCAFGIERNGNIEVDDKVMKQHLQRLIECRLNQLPMPYDIVRALSVKTMSPQAYEKKRDYLQFTACAVIRKYYLDKYKEEYKVSLEKEKKDISYQYGRLLAILEKAERDTYEKSDGREPNAIRMQSAFCAHPFQTSEIIIKQIKNAYYPKLSYASKITYDKLVGEIFEIISSFPETMWNLPLKETYIMGYYLQKNALYTKKEKLNESEENENE